MKERVQVDAAHWQGLALTLILILVLDSEQVVHTAILHIALSAEISSLSAMSESSVPLPYTVSQCSAHSGRYVADNILVDNPLDQSSRWSGAYQGNVKQWIILQLETLVVLSCVDSKFYLFEYSG